MRFLTDQDVYQCTIDYLCALGHDVLRAKDAGLARASDEELLRYAYREQRLLITRDKGFGALVFLVHRQHSGVILLRIDPLSVDAVHQELRRLLEEHTEIELRNRFVVVEPGRHRIRISRSAASGDQ